MLKSAGYVLDENIKNIYRIYTIVKYEVIVDVRDSKLGMLWNILSPIIQVLTYWFVFGYVFHRNDVDGIDYFSWLLGGMVFWFFVNPCITSGCSAVLQKITIITKMKFPVSILPATVILKEAYNHVCLILILLLFLISKGHYPCLSWLFLIYYFLATIIFCISLSLLTSVLTMLARDVKKLIVSMMRLLMYMTPVFWSIDSIPENLRNYFKLNPLYHLVTGYRDCLFYHNNPLIHWKTAIVFWSWTLFFFLLGSLFMYRFREKFIDLV